MVRSELRVAEHGVGVGRIGRSSGGALGVVQGLGCVAGANQQCGVIDKDGGIFRLKAESVLEIQPRLGDVAMVEFKFPGDEIGGRAQLGVAFALQSGESLGVDFAILNESSNQIAFVRESVRGRKVRKVGYFGRSRGRMTGHSPRIYMIHN